MKLINKEKVITSVDNVFAIIPVSTFSSINEDTLTIRNGNKRTKFNKINKSQILKFVYQNNDRYFTGITFYSNAQIKRMEEVCESLGFSDMDHTIYENKEKDGDFPLVINFGNVLFFLLAPIDKSVVNDVNSEGDN